MTDDLRTRIAAVLVGGCPCFDCTAVALEKADAVIRELEADYILVPKGHTLARIATQTKQFGPSPRIATRKADDE